MKKPNILIIDDDDSLRRVMEFSLTEANYRVATAASGEEGLRLFEENAFFSQAVDVGCFGLRVSA